MKIILASQSQIRRRALELLNLPYEIVPSNIDEKSIRDPHPLQLALKLSEAKAKEIAKHHQGIIIASDAFMVFQEAIVEKPQDMNEAYQMLSNFSGSHYTFVTGLAVYNSYTSLMLSTTESCTIHFRTLRETEIKDYITRYPVLKFAGAHETDGVVRFSERIQGNCNFFTALPMNKLVEFLHLQGVFI